jgi:hypothetical protein
MIFYVTDIVCLINLNVACPMPLRLWGENPIPGRIRAAVAKNLMPFFCGLPSGLSRRAATAPAHRGWQSQHPGGLVCCQPGRSHISVRVLRAASFRKKIRAGGTGPQQQSRAPRLCKTGVDEIAVTGAIRTGSGKGGTGNLTLLSHFKGETKRSFHHLAPKSS